MQPFLARRRVASMLVLLACALAGAELIAGLWLDSLRVEHETHHCGLGSLGYVIGLFVVVTGAPVLACASHLIATRRSRSAIVLIGSGLAVTAAVGIPLGFGGMVMTAALPALMTALVLPVLLLVARAARRDDLDADDVLLAGGGAWLAAIELATWLVFGPVLAIPLTGIALGVVAAVLGVARIANRRRALREAASVRATEHGPYRALQSLPQA